MTHDIPRLVAFAGYANAGKDEAAKALLARGYIRHNFGDVIKRQVDRLIKRYFGFSAFTEDRTQKERIRRTLESWGEDNYDRILKDFLGGVPDLGVNTRLVRCREATAWRALGGVIVEVDRGNEPATAWERDRLAELRAAGFIDATVKNDSTVEDLHRAVIDELQKLQLRGVA